jgi:predicted dehydrogenase
MHKQFAVPALEKGYHVLLEKPMEVTEEDSRAIIEAADRSKAKLMIAYRLHCEPGTLNILERVRRGDLGDPRIFSSVFTQALKEENHRGQNGFEAGPIPDMGPYPINAVRNLFGDEPTEVQAVGFKTPGKQFTLEYDTISVTLRFPQERIAQFVVGYAAVGHESYRVVGTKGDIDVSPCYLFGPGVKIAYKAKIEGKEESKEFPEVDHFAGETEYFSDCILNDHDPEPNGEEGLMDVRIIVAIRKALETGQPQKLAPLRPRTKRMELDQKKEIKLAPQPKQFIGRDAQEPAKSQA